MCILIFATLNDKLFEVNLVHVDLRTIMKLRASTKSQSSVIALEPLDLRVDPCGPEACNHSTPSYCPS